MKKVELLAPAGDWEAFLAAVENGADAVYLGGKLFNARQFAGNFSEDEIKKALEYSHIRGVKIYLTLNTLLSDSEQKDALDFVKNIYVLGIDGIIVQDLGFASILRNLLPDLPLHASTQMTVYNKEGVKLLEQLGFKRAVLARELSIKEIKEICSNTSMEIEIFIHGAQCICYSGQCLMSSIIGGRSGNRGKCAQPCRLPYDLIKSQKQSTNSHSLVKTIGKYLLSPKDLCSLEELQKVMISGAHSLKIEGRMKSPEYVATVVKMYRKYIDMVYNSDAAAEIQDFHVNENDIRELSQIFNRGGLSKGYLTGKSSKELMCWEKPKNWGTYLGEVVSYDNFSQMVKIRLDQDISLGDGIEIWNGEENSPGNIVTEIKQNGSNTELALKGDSASLGSLRGKIFQGNKVYKTSDKRLLESVRQSFNGRFIKKVTLNCRINILSGESLRFEVWDCDDNRVEIISEYIPQVAINVPISSDRVSEQLRKTGSTPFEFGSIEIKMDSNLAVSIGEINNIRRKALEEIEKIRYISHERFLPKDIEKAEIVLARKTEALETLDKLKLSVFFFNILEKQGFSSLGVDRIYLPFTSFLTKKSMEIVEECHRNECEVFAWLPSITRGNYDNLIKSKMEEIAGSGIDGLLVSNLGQLVGGKMIGDTSLNVFNSLSALELKKLGLKGATLSYELTLNQILKLSKPSDFDLEAVIYGRIPLMTSEYCPVGSIVGGHTSGNACDNACQSGSYYLKDRKGMDFAVICDEVDCRSTIMNSNVLFLIESIEKLKKAGVDYVRLNITDEDADTTKEIVEMHLKAIKSGIGSLFEYSDIIEKIKSQGFTKGHYFRGV